MNRLICVLVFVLFAFSGLMAQDETNTKLDSVLNNQNRMLNNQKKILGEVTYVDPLAGRHFGIEFSPALLVAGLSGDYVIVSAGFSLFNLAPQAEIAFPVYYSHATKNETHDLLTADVHYRLFFSDRRKGFYASAGLRYAYLKGESSHYDWNPLTGYDDEWQTVETAHKFGIFFGIGYRYFSKIGLYWGAGLITGTYFSDDSDKFNDTYFMDEGKFLLDMEFLKIGYAF